MSVNFGGRSGDSGSLGSLFRDNYNDKKKYVNINLSGSTLTTIPVGTFTYCSDLVGIILPNSIEIIKNGAFQCTGLTNITIPNGVTDIGIDAFRECANLTGIIISDSVTNIGSWAFLKCTKLANVTMGNGVQLIGHSAFGYCTSLGEITIPASVIKVGVLAFGYCANLLIVNIQCNIPSYLKSDPESDNTFIEDTAIGSSVGELGDDYIGDLFFKYYAIDMGDALMVQGLSSRTTFYTGRPGTYYRTSSASLDWIYEG